MHHSTRQAQLIWHQSQNKTGHQRHVRAVLDPGVLYTLNPKWRQTADAKFADKVFAGLSFELRWDKRSRHSQDYSVCRGAWNNVSSGSTVCSDSLFQRLPLYRTPCFHVREKELCFFFSFQERNCIQTLNIVQRLWNHPFWVFLWLFSCFVATEQRVNEAALRRQSHPIQHSSPLSGSDFKLGHTVCKHCNHWTEAVQCVKVAAVLWTATIIAACVASPSEAWSLWPDVTWISTASARRLSLPVSLALRETRLRAFGRLKPVHLYLLLTQSTCARAWNAIKNTIFCFIRA